MVATGGPPRARRAQGKWAALAMALAVNVLFVAVLVFSVSWQNRAPEAVTAELYAPPVTTPSRPEPVPRATPRPPPVPDPPKPPPEPRVDKPDPRAADIALKARQEAQRRERAEDEQRKEAAEKRAQEDKRAAEQKARQQKELDAMRAQAERETQQRAKSERDVQQKAQAERDAQIRAAAARESEQRAAAAAEGRARAAAAGARDRAQAAWIDNIRAKIKGNLTLPPDLAGNPEAVFDVVQLPTGEIIDVRLRRSSGVRAYDDAVQRAILKSTPLPKPERPDQFERELTLRFRPVD